MRQMITVTQLKSFEISVPKVLVGTTTHSNGSRMKVLKRNILNLNAQECRDWGQLIMIDHSPESVAKEIIEMVKELPFSEKREVYWMHGEKPTGLWGKSAHQYILDLCQSKYYSFHSDDNFLAFNHLSSLCALLDVHAELDFVFSHCYRINQNKSIMRLNGFDLCETDLGSPLFRVDSCFRKVLPDLKVLPNVYAWDWEIMKVLTKAELKFACSGLATYIWTQMHPCDEKTLEQSAIKKDISKFKKIKAKYPGFKIY